jgi:peptidoglycan/LPS O-acetylase OafA/YrhL
MKLLKKCFAYILIMATILMSPMVVFAADSSPTDVPADNYLTWEFIASFAGAVFVVTMIVQFLKLPLDRVWKVPTRFIVFLIALLILFLVLFFTDTITPEKAALTVLNAIVVTMAAMGAYEVTLKKIEKWFESKPPG